MRKATPPEHIPSVCAPPRFPRGSGGDAAPPPSRVGILAEIPGLIEELQALVLACGGQPSLIEKDVDWHGYDLILTHPGCGLLPPREGVETVVAATDLHSENQLLSTAVAVRAVETFRLPNELSSMADFVARMVDTGRGLEANTCGVISTRGGLGSTTLALSVSWAMARRGVDTVLVDTDHVGLGIGSRMAPQPGGALSWMHFENANGRLATQGFRESLPREGRLSWLSWSGMADIPRPPLTTESFLSVLEAARRAFGCVVVDLKSSWMGAPVLMKDLDLALCLAAPQPEDLMASRGWLGGDQAKKAAHARPLQAVAFRGRLPQGIGKKFVEQHVGVPLWGTIIEHGALSKSARGSQLGRLLEKSSYEVVAQRAAASLLTLGQDTERGRLP